jgi:hypothetical protein
MRCRSEPENLNFARGVSGVFALVLSRVNFPRRLAESLFSFSRAVAMPPFCVVDIAVLHALYCGAHESDGLSASGKFGGNAFLRHQHAHEAYEVHL